LLPDGSGYFTCKIHICATVCTKYDYMHTNILYRRFGSKYQAPVPYIVVPRLGELN